MPEFHLALKTHQLHQSVRFFAWLLNEEPKTYFPNRYAVFVCKSRSLNLVLVRENDASSYESPVHHIGIEVSTCDDVIEKFDSALSEGVEIRREPETTYSGTPLHQLWLKSPDGTDVEVYARLSADELIEYEHDQAQTSLDRDGEAR